MLKHFSILPVFAILLCSACGDSKDVKLPKDDTKTAAGKEKETKSEDPETRSAGSTSSGSSSASSTSPNPSGAFETKLESLVTQKAPWGDIEISVEKARVLRGDKPTGFPSAATHSKSSVYAILDLKLASKGDEENDYGKRDTWDLLLEDGTRVKPLNAVGVVLPAGGTKTASLFYKVADDAKLVGASVEINGSDRDALEPLAIPLDAKSEFASQVKLSDLVGETFESDGKAGLSYEIVDAVYGVNLEDTGRRAPRDQRLVELTVQVGYDGNSDQTSFDSANDAPRLSFDDHVFAPDAFDTRTIDSGKSHDFVMVYRINENASHFDLVFDSSDFEGHWMTDVELPPLLDRDRDRTSSDDEIDSSDDDSNDEVDNSDDDSEDEFDSSDDSSGDDEFDSSDESFEEEFDSSDDFGDDFNDDSDE